MKMEPKLSATILDIISCWRKNRIIIHTYYLTIFGIREAVKEQSEGLRWTNFVLGRQSPKWQTVQQLYLKSIRSRKSSLCYMDSRSNPQIAHDCVECMEFQKQYQQRKKWSGLFTKKHELYRTINKKYNLGITTLCLKACHLIQVYYKRTLFQMKFGRQRDWIKQIQLARK